jgi:predicted DNA-binding helix-hairpin-helix protein
MDTHEKLQLLSDASQYDLACACGTSSSDRRQRGSDGAWLYPVSLPGGGYSVMLKTLMSNVCVNDCGYCPYRSDTDSERCTISPDAMAKLYLDYVQQKKVFGLFLSSGVVGTPDKTMEMLNDTARILRSTHKYKGYIHLKVIPGASDAAIEDAMSLASAVSINIEAPGEHRFRKLSVRKNYLRDIIGPLQQISKFSEEPRFSKVKKTTQFIVGASDETDSEIVRYTAGLYKKLKLNRVYFSSYQKGLGDSRIPGENQECKRADQGFVREHRLYQVDFLFRQYGFNEADIFFDGDMNLSLDTDPKKVWAQCHPEFYPVNVNRADKQTLLRVPGIGPETVRKIIQLRKQSRICRVDALPMVRKYREEAASYVSF